MSAPGPAPAPPSTLRVALLLGSMTALTVLASSAIAVALPQLAAELGLTAGTSAWVLASFSVTFALATPVFGRLVDLAGLRRPLVAGVMLLSAGSLVAAAATSFPVLVLGRLLQGAGGGAVPVLAVAILQRSMPRAQVGRALGALTAVVTIVSGSGPLVGGLLAQLAGWRVILGVPALVLALAAPVARLAPDRARAAGSLDSRGLLLVTAAVGGLMLFLQGTGTGLGVAGMALFGAVCAVAAVLLALHVRARPAGFLPRAVVGNATLVRASLAGATLIAAYVSMLFSLPKLLAADGWAPLAIGALMLPGAAFGAVSSRLGGSGASRRHGRVVVVGCAVATAAGTVVAGAGSASPALLVVGFGLVAGGFGAGQVVLVDALPRLVGPAVRGSALGVFNLVFFTGSAVGAAVLASLVDLLGVPGALMAVAALPAVGAGLAASADLAPP